MKHFVGLSVALSFAALTMACSSTTSTTTTEDAGNGISTNNDSGSTGQTGSDASLGTPDSGTSTTVDSGSTPTDSGLACPPAAIPTGDGGVPTFTAPALDQSICTVAEISAFATACSGTTCGTWANSNDAGAACTNCLLSTGSVIAPFEVLGNSGYIIPSLGACVLATAGSGAAACAIALDEAEYCVNYACAMCTATTGNACATAASTGECATVGGAVSGACSSYDAAFTACKASQGTVAGLTAAGNAICGAGAVDAGDQ